MFLYSLNRTKIELVHENDGSPFAAVDGPPLDIAAARKAQETARVIGASTRYFVDRDDAAKTGRTSPHRPATVYRDPATQLVRCFYREIVVRFKTRVPASRRISHLEDVGFQMVRRGESRHQYIVRDPRDRNQGDDLIRLANTLAERDDEIVYAVPNFVSEFRRTSPPTIPKAQWHLKNSGQYFGQVPGQDVRAEQGWQIESGKPSITVAILDDGVDLSHPALQNQIYTNQPGRDYFLTPNDPDFNNPRPKIFTAPYDDSDHNDIHGTACAGLVAASAPDSRAYGVAPGCKILAVKIFHAAALASELYVANAITYAASIADVLSCSWHGPESAVIEQALASAASSGRQRRGCSIFCSVGDDSGGTVRFPASSMSCIAIGASTDDGQPALYSNAGQKVAMVAPSNGGSQAIFTCNVSAPGMGYNPGDDDHGGVDGLYTNRFGGTSAAVPIAAGAAAVLLSHRPDLTATRLSQIMQQTADKIVDDVDANGHNIQVGFGKINLLAALNAL